MGHVPLLVPSAASHLTWPRDTCRGSCYQCCNTLQKLQDHQASPQSSPRPGTTPVLSRGDRCQKWPNAEPADLCGHLGTRTRDAALYGGLLVTAGVCDRSLLPSVTENRGGAPSAPPARWGPGCHGRGPGLISSCLTLGLLRMKLAWHKHLQEPRQRLPASPREPCGS